MPLRRLPRELWIPVGLSGVVTVVVAFLVFGTLQQPELPTFPPSTVAPADVGNALVGPLTYTVDAREETGWRYFDFSVGAEVFEPGPTEWDLAFRRFNIIANGGAGFFGSAGIRDLGPVSFDSLVAVPLDGYTVTTAGRDSVNAAIGRWYSYSWSSHATYRVCAASVTAARPSRLKWCVEPTPHFPGRS